MRKPKITIDKYFFADVTEPHTIHDSGRSYHYGPSLNLNGTYHLTPAQAKKFKMWLTKAIKWMEKQ